MNFDEAINTHIAWKKKLRDFILNRVGAYDVNVVCQDNLCEFGKWLYVEGGRKYASFPKFNELISVHAKFHKLAADILIKAQEGKKEEALKMLEEKSDYSQCSSKCIMLIEKIKLKSKMVA
ncbi:MAG: CZB domain-containing protein [Oligoflexia bacterium]|nr:CZB domain-containing protein [Oligoflexia bacterium]